MGSQAWLSDDSQNSNAKCSVQAKCNTSMHQATTPKVQNLPCAEKSNNSQRKKGALPGLIMQICLPCLSFRSGKRKYLQSIKISL